ncbi:MAG: O-antigen ligase family protein [Bacteroidaceae bacterium]|nr:O-antigen ligase family protein [Bacteroidaceae bacterium]
MQLDFKQITLLPACIMVLVLMQVVVSFNVFAFLRPVSLLVWGLCILNWLAVGCLYLREAEMSPFGLLWAVYFLIISASTLIHATSFKMLSYLMVDGTLLLMLFHYYQHRLRMLVIAANVFFSGVIYANLALMFFFPNWMFVAQDSFDSFILGGNYNQMGGRFLCGIVTSVLCIKFNRKWLINSIALIVVAIATLLFVGSMTAVTGLAVFTLFCIVPSFRLQRIGLVSFFIFYLLFQIFVCFRGEGLHNSELARYFIVDVLGKDITFTNRTMMWDLALRQFFQSPLVGFGCVDNDWYINNMTSFARGPHNFILGQLINGGVLLMSVLIGIVIISVRRILGCFDRMACILCMGLATLCFMMLMEVYPFVLVLYMLVLLYYYPEYTTPEISTDDEREC